MRLVRDREWDQVKDWEGTMDNYILHPGRVVIYCFYQDVNIHKPSAEGQLFSL